MSKSGQLRLRDVRDAYRLIGDCRDLGSDPALWHRRMFEGLASLIGAAVITGGEGQWLRPDGALTPASGFSVGLDARGQERLMHYLRNNGFVDDPVFQAMRNIPGALVVRTRHQTVSDAKWYRSRTFTEYVRPLHCDHLVRSVRQTSKAQAISVITLQRGSGERNFSEREQCLLHFCHDELGRLVGTALVSVFDADPLQLPRRQRETLACLLEGDSEKQVAARLGLSPLTAHQYVKSLYRHFGVQSRAELLAYFLRRERARRRLETSDGSGEKISTPP